MGLVEPYQESQTPAPEPGLYPGVPHDVYASWDAVNQTILNGFARPPAKVYHDLQTGGKPPTAAMELGWLTHLAILEPDRYTAEVAIAPQVERKRSGKGKRIWDDFVLQNRNKIIATIGEDQKARAMARSVWAHKTARQLLTGRGRNEIAVVWFEKSGDFRIKCKARLDRYTALNEWPVLVDLKSSRSAGRREFERAILNYGYDVQAAHYLSGLETLHAVQSGDPFRRFLLIVVESEPPHLCAVREINDESIQEGERKRKTYLHTWRECIESGEWPGYSEGIEEVGLPAWALKEWID